jgi:hypothetical protein
VYAEIAEEEVKEGRDREGKIVCWKSERRLERTRKYGVGRDSERNKIYPVAYDEKRDFLSLVAIETELTMRIIRPVFEF